MGKEPKKVEEVVWTGQSDRTVRNDAEFYEPGKSAVGKVAYKETDEAPPSAKKHIPAPASKAGIAPAPKPASAPAKRPAPAPKPAPAPQAKPVPKAKPTPTPAPAPAPAQAATARDKGRVIAQTVVGSFVDRMKAEAQRKGGSLSLNDLEALDEEFEEKTAALEVLFEKTFEDFARTYAKSAGEERRENPFDRLIVGPFEKLLSGGKGPSTAKGGISRRIMPGFFMALNIMLGPDEVAAFRAEAKAIFDRVNKARDNIDWQAYFAEAKNLRLSVLIAMAVHFANPDKRAAWFLDMINNHLSPPESDTDPDANWTLSRPAYERMIDRLFADLMTAVGSPKAREAITKRFGPETCASVAAIMKGMGA